MPTLNVNQIEIYYEIKGKGTPLTMIMGQGCSLRQWEWMSDVLSSSFKVITFDSRGAGKSGKPDMEYSTEMFAEDTFSLLEKIGVRKSHILGVSFGGMIAQRFALMFPEITDRLILGATMPSYHLFPPSQKTVETLQASALVPIPKSIQIIMKLFYSKHFFQEEPALAAKVKKIMVTEKEEQGIDIMYRQIGAGMKHDTSEEVRNIKAPTLVICGDEDLISPIRNSRFLTDQIPGSTLAVLSGGYHAFWIERADEACEIITNFLK